ncbi:hypothetical protein BJ912DRAFT_639223 [Pholiota molesta]|nr:hypothetical protein BJ912DRAFT_639223 [Pholiota molesta]
MAKLATAPQHVLCTEGQYTSIVAPAQVMSSVFCRTIRGPRFRAPHTTAVSPPPQPTLQAHPWPPEERLGNTPAIPAGRLYLSPRRVLAAQFTPGVINEARAAYRDSLPANTSTTSGPLSAASTSYSSGSFSSAASSYGAHVVADPMSATVAAAARAISPSPTPSAMRACLRRAGDVAAGERQPDAAEAVHGRAWRPDRRAGRALVNAAGSCPRMMTTTTSGSAGRRWARPRGCGWLGGAGASANAGSLKMGSRDGGLQGCHPRRRRRCPAGASARSPRMVLQYRRRERDDRLPSSTRTTCRPSRRADEQDALQVH